MRLETLRLQNFRGYVDREFTLHPQFNLVIGENGSGKTSFLEAAAVAIGSWLLGFRGHDSKNIRKRDVRQLVELVENRHRELYQYPVRVTATGKLHIARAGRLDPAGDIAYLATASDPNPHEIMVEWQRSLESPDGRTTRSGTKNLQQTADSMVDAVLKQRPYVLPLIRYFGAGRLWEAVKSKPSQSAPPDWARSLAEIGELLDFQVDKNSIATESITARDNLTENKILYPIDLTIHTIGAKNEFEETKDLTDPFYGYHMSVDKRCNPDDLIHWMREERLTELDEETTSPALRLVYRAIESLLPEVDFARYSKNLRTLVIHYKNGKIHSFSELSDGYRNVVAIAADLAIKAIMLNPQLAEKALEMTPGVVLIDELDLHLHPKWQRRVIGDLRRTFPMVQFICTTHSPQLIGQVKPEEIIYLGFPGMRTDQSYGMDSNWILRHVMDSDDRDPVISERLDALFEDIESADFESAQTKLCALREELGDHPDLVEAEALIGRYTRFDTPGAE